jgi:DNA-binding protein HU-beta
MNKADLIAHVAQQAKLTKADSEKAVNAVFDGISASLKKGQDAAFVGFGTFKILKTAARTGRNPRTGEAIKIAASKRPKFQAGKALKDAVNG